MGKRSTTDLGNFKRGIDGEPIIDASGIDGSEGADGGDTGGLDPAAAIGAGSGDGDADSGAGEGKRRRGRPRSSGSLAATKKKNKALGVDKLAAILYTVHLNGSLLLSMPEMELDKEEADKVAKAGGEVLQHYDIGEMPEKVVDWVNLITVLMLVYGTRIAAIRIRYKAEAAEKAASDAALSLHG